ncbi:MAG: hypothetical protein ACLFV8_07880, partial [Alphaproteobacteria bacterium]
GGYYPQYFANIEDEQAAIRRLFALVGTGKVPFPVGVWDYTQVTTAEKQHTDTDGQAGERHRDKKGGATAPLS